ncbi:hypothetical protein CG747_01320 [Streptomyces sp. CB02959]|nr:hypothetical protein CG747_01320 [Streptomyces sp. CB02959]
MGGLAGGRRAELTGARPRARGVPPGARTHARAATRRSRLNGDLQGEFTVGAVWLSSGTHTADDVRVRGPRAVRGGRGQL